METRLLQYFLAVAEEQSITKAADYLHITQPTLSKQMMDLEAALGKQLLIRGKKKVTLTEDGAYLLGKAQEIISLIEKTENSFHEGEQTITGDVYIGCGEFRSTYAIMEVIRSIQQGNPGISFHFFSGNGDLIIERLDKGLLDIGILLEPKISPRYDYQKLPFCETWGVLMRKDSPLASHESISANDLSGLPLIVSNQTFNSNKSIAFFEENKPASHIVASYNLIYNAGLMVEAGIGYALCIDGLINTTGDSPLTFRPLVSTFQPSLYLFTKKYQTFSKATKLFLTRFQEEMNKNFQNLPCDNK
ncbi:MAG: LysR family transcriptional regulator [Lachnospiraceae bacterium]|nr:LysR family transcriptional regulator [Lachnospiraceae bacterium]